MSTWLVVGLGNPGPRYAGNRHNVGAMVAAQLAARHDAGALGVRKLASSRGAVLFRPHKARAQICEVRFGFGSGAVPGPRAVLAIPMTFMNESGGPVSALLKFWSVDLDHLVVVHDDLDLPPGTVRLKRGGGEGGHNGLRSISTSLGSRDYHRVRVGIGRPPGRMDAADFVLRDFTAAERAELAFTLDTAAEAVESLVEIGLLETQQRFHSA